jgi:hypothetical protein
VDGQLPLGCLAIGKYIRVTDTVRAQIKNINKHAKQIGKTSGRVNIAKGLGLPGGLPLAVPDCINNVLSLFCMVIVDNFISRFLATPGVKKKETFYRSF